MLEEPVNINNTNKINKIITRIASENVSNKIGSLCIHVIIIFLKKFTVAYFLIHEVIKVT